MSLIGRSITRRECAKCGAAVGEVHADECPVDRHAPIVEVEYVPAEQLRGAVAENERLRQVIMLARDRLDVLPISPRLIIARDGLDAALDGGQ